MIQINYYTNHLIHIQLDKLSIFLSFTPSKFLEIDIVRKRFLIVLGVLLVSNLLLAYMWIPSSHFIYVMWGAIGLYSLSLYNHFNIKK